MSFKILIHVDFNLLNFIQLSEFKKKTGFIVHFRETLQKVTVLEHVKHLSP